MEAELRERSVKPLRFTTKNPGNSSWFHHSSFLAKYPIKTNLCSSLWRLSVQAVTHSPPNLLPAVWIFEYDKLKSKTSSSNSHGENATCDCWSGQKQLGGRTCKQARCHGFILHVHICLVRSDSASRLHYFYSVAPSAAQSVHLNTKHHLHRGHTQSGDTQHALFSWLLLFLQSQSPISFFIDDKLTDRLLSAPALGDSTFSLHTLNLQCVLKSQVLHFAVRTKFLVSDTWRSNAVTTPLKSFLLSSRRRWVGSCSVWNNESLGWYGTRSPPCLRGQSFCKIEDSLLAAVGLGDVTSSRRGISRGTRTVFRFGCMMSSVGLDGALQRLSPGSCLLGCVAYNLFTESLCYKVKECIMGNVGSTIFGALLIVRIKNRDILVSAASVLTPRFKICLSWSCCSTP